MAGPIVAVLNRERRVSPLAARSRRCEPCNDEHATALMSTQKDILSAHHDGYAIHKIILQRKTRPDSLLCDLDEPSVFGHISSTASVAWRSFVPSIVFTASSAEARASKVIVASLGCAPAE